MNLIEKIANYRQMAKEYNAICPDHTEISHRIIDLSIAEMNMLSDHYCVPIDSSISKDRVCLYLKNDNCTIYCWSVNVEIKTSVEFRELTKEIAA